MIALERITHAEACGYHRGQACDCDRAQLHALITELPLVIAAATAPHAARAWGSTCHTCIAERRLRAFGRQFRGETP